MYICTAGEAIPVEGAFFGAGVGMVWMEKLQCLGTERHILNCSRGQNSAYSSCRHSQDVSVICPGKAHTLTRKPFCQIRSPKFWPDCEVFCRIYIHLNPANYVILEVYWIVVCPHIKFAPYFDICIEALAVLCTMPYTYSW